MYVSDPIRLFIHVVVKLRRRATVLLIVYGKRPPILITADRHRRA
jgi:hypothetical protein